MAVTEGVAGGVLPSDGSSTPKFTHGYLMPSDSRLYLPRLENTTSYNTKVALYDSLGNPLLVADDAAFTPGTNRVVPIGALADETGPDSVDEGDIGIPRMTLNRLLRVVPTGVGGAEVALLDDAAFTPATSLVVPMGALADETAPDSVNEGDVGAPRMTLARILKTETRPGTPTTLAIEETANDSDKTITPTAGRTWEITSIRVSLVSTATVGNRTLAIDLRRASDSKVLASFKAAINQAASLTREYLWQAGGPQETAFGAVGDQIRLSLPTPFLITDTEEMRVYDTAVVDAAADDMSVFVYGVETVE